MANKPWKRTERKVAAYYGGKRIPVTGRQRGDVPDIEHDWISFEVKHRQSVPEWILDAMRQAIAAKGDEKLPVVVIHQSGTRHDNDLVVLTAYDFREWFCGGAVDKVKP